MQSYSEDKAGGNPSLWSTPELKWVGTSPLFLPRPSLTPVPKESCVVLPNERSGKSASLGTPGSGLTVFLLEVLRERKLCLKAEKAPSHGNPFSCSSLLRNRLFLPGTPTAPFNSQNLDQSPNLFSSLSLLVKAMHCGYFWFFLFNYISLCLLWSELIDLFSWGVASVLYDAE